MEDKKVDVIIDEIEEEEETDPPVTIYGMSYDEIMKVVNK